MEGLQAKISEAWFNYAHAQQDVQLGAQRNVEELQRRYAAALRSLGEEIQNRYREAYNSYYHRLQEISSQPDYWTRSTDVNREFLTQLQKLQEETSRRLDETWRQFGSDLSDAQQLSQTSIREAYKNYLRAQQDAWGSVDVSALMG
jgi:hypothetical protein